MHRITVSLPDDLAQMVAHEADRTGSSVSALVRKALEKILGVAEDTPRELPFASLGRSGQRDTARNAEAILAQEWARDRHR